MRLIDADALKEAVKNNVPYVEQEIILDIINDAPTVDNPYQEGHIDGMLQAEKLYARPQGEWVEYKENGETMYYCSICFVTKGQAVNNFCACCGARMGGGNT